MSNTTPQPQPSSTNTVLTSTIITLLLLIGGTVLVSLGAFLLSVPVGFIVSGALLVFYGVIIGFRV